MTTAPSTRRRPRLSTRNLTVRMIAASLAAAGAIFGGLAVQMANGHDPALGARTSSARTTAQDSGGAQTGGSSLQQDQSGGSASGVVTRAS
ncbi:MAG TPA: hypothetical protein VF072_03380 [Thermoleophilaceae bacterium]